jgi:hypothetical protein
MLIDSGSYKKRIIEGAPGAAGATVSIAPVVPGAPAAAPGYIPVGGGGTPDYNALIRSDPSYMAYLNSSKLDLDQAASARKAALQKLAIQYGGLPTGFQDKYGDIDQGTLELAQKNEFSDVKRIGRSYEQGVEQFKRALAARGALQSGELGYGLDQAELNRAEREYDVGNQFSNAYAGVANDYVGTESRVRQGEAGAIAQAQQNVFSNPANRPADAIEASLDSGATSQYGQPLYRHPDGTLWTLSGTLFTPPVASSLSSEPIGYDEVPTANTLLGGRY